VFDVKKTDAKAPATSKESEITTKLQLPTTTGQTDALQHE
jgi:hypothetical protein